MIVIHKKCLAHAVAVGIAVSISAAGYAASPAPQASSTNGKSQPKQLQAIQVTASRINRVALTFPTPEVPISPQTLDLNINPNVGASLDNLPYFRGSVNANNGAQNGGAGEYTADLRGLGSARTLVLLNGKRFIDSGNLNTIPSVLIKRVQVVTGGASASWGSGAVAGVVNVILNKNFQGTEIGGAIGLSSAKDARERKFEFATGDDYAGGKGHFEFGLNYIDRDKVWPARTARDDEGAALPVPLPSGMLELRTHEGQASLAPGGIILSGALKGHIFNPDGTLRPSGYGTPLGGLVPGAPNINDWGPLLAPIKDFAAIANTSYHLTDNTTLTAQIQHFGMWNSYPWFQPGNSDITINVDNAFLPSAIRQVLLKNNEQSFTLGRLNNDIGVPGLHFRRGMTNITLGLNGTIGTWRWSTYATYGKHKYNIASPHTPITQNFNQSVDSVISPTTGQPVCRVSLTDPSTSCVPIDLFGQGAPSQAAINYVTGTPVSFENDRLAVFSAEIQGSPWEVPAGLVSIAAGVDWRYNSSQTSIPEDQVKGIFALDNFGAVKGKDNVKEAFGEVFVPLLKDVPLFKNLAMDAAGRLSDYSQSGKIWSWKVGFVNQFGDGFNWRVDLSRDIRAPSVGELFSSPGEQIATLFDPVSRQTVFIPEFEPGNPNLRPEKAQTLTAGVSWSPSDRNFSMGVDYFHIQIKNVITSISPQDIVNRCFSSNNESSICSLITRKPDGTLVSILDEELNLATYKTDGADFNFSYSHPAELFGMGGNIRLRALATWVQKLTVNDGTSTVNYLGTTADGNSMGVPRWKGIASFGFDSSKLSVGGRLRWIGRGNFDRNLDIVNNKIGNYFYIDLNSSYKLGHDGRYDIYFNVLNLANKQPPIGSSGNFSAYYDVMGRYYTLGLRVRFM